MNLPNWILRFSIGEYQLNPFIVTLSDSSKLFYSSASLCTEFVHLKIKIWILSESEGLSLRSRRHWLTEFPINTRRVTNTESGFQTFHSNAIWKLFGSKKVIIPIYLTSASDASHLRHLNTNESLVACWIIFYYWKFFSCRRNLND